MLIIQESAVYVESKLLLVFFFIHLTRALSAIFDNIGTQVYGKQFIS